MRNTRWFKLPLISLLCAFLLLFGVIPQTDAAAELTLQDSIAMTISNDPVLKAAEAELNAAQARLKEARAGRFPTLTYDMNTVHGQLESSGETTQLVENNLQLNWPLYKGGRIGATIAQALTNLQSVDLKVKQIHQQIRLDVTLSYDRLLETQSASLLAEETVVRINEHLRHVKARLTLGTAAKLDLIRVELELSKAEQAQVRAKKAHALAIASFNQKLGRTLDQAIVLHVPLSLRHEKPTLKSCLLDAMKNRPERLQAENDVAMTEYGVAIAKAEAYPLISLVASADGSDRHFPGTADDTWSLGISAHWTLFDSGRNRSRTGQAEAEVIKAQENLRKILSDIEFDVTQACLELEEAEQLMELSRAAVATAEEEYKMAQAGYEAGYETSLYVLDSQGALSQAKTAYLIASTTYNGSWARLHKAIGTF